MPNKERNLSKIEEYESVMELDVDPEVTSSMGVPRFTKRLSDKILMAYNHAFAVGELDLAQDLFKALEVAEEQERQIATRMEFGAVNLARCWEAFVNSRNIYETCQVEVPVDTHRLDAAVESMMAAYNQWTFALNRRPEDAA